MTEDETPIQAPLHVTPPKDPELLKLWQDFLQKCCEVGQIEFQLSQLDAQRRQMEKNLEVTQRATKSVAQKHRDLQQKIMASPTPPPIEKLVTETEQAQSH